MNFKAIGKTIGVILSIEAGFMLPPLFMALADGNGNIAKAFAISAAAALAVGLPLVLNRKWQDRLGARDGFAAAVLAWLAMSLFGALPYLLGGVIPSATDAFFETVSGFTTSSATVISDVEAMPRSVLLWRSITNWLGGMGVLVFLLAVTPAAKEGGSMYLLRAEFPGPTATKLVPRMQKSAKLLYIIYIIMTLVMIVLLSFDVPLFDAVNISLSTVSTGGFEIKNDSLMSYSRYAQAVTTLFMILCGMSFSIFYCLAVRDFSRIKRNAELKAFALIFGLSCLIVGLSSYKSFDGFGEGLHYTLFEVSSIISTTAHTAVDSSVWSQLALSLLMLLMIVGPMSGSTGGGMKISRLMILLKTAKRTLGRIIIPNSVHVIHLGGDAVDEETTATVSTFFAVYLLLMLVTAVLLSFEGIDFGEGVTAAISSLSNIGATEMKGYGVLGKLLLAFDMILGRLEIFPVLVLFAPQTWRK